MTLQEQIDALPTWPVPWLPVGVTHGGNTPDRYREQQAHCALARLALARAWIDEAPHHLLCPSTPGWADPAPCTCGRDALLAALAPPR